MAKFKLCVKSYESVVEIDDKEMTRYIGTDREAFLYYWLRDHLLSNMEWEWKELK